MAAATSDPKAKTYLLDDAKMMDGMAKEREDLANHNDPNTPCPPKTQATNGGNTGTGNKQVSQNTGGGATGNGGTGTAASSGSGGGGFARRTSQCLIDVKLVEPSKNTLGVNFSCGSQNPVSTIPGQTAVIPEKGILIQTPQPSFTIDSNIPISGFSSTGGNLIISRGMSFTSPGGNPYSTTILLPENQSSTGTKNYNFNFNLNTTGMNGKNAIVSFDGSPGVNLISQFSAPPIYSGYVFNGEVYGFGPPDLSFGTWLDLQSRVDNMVKTRLPDQINAMLSSCTAKTPTLTSFTPGANGSGEISLQFDCKGNDMPANSVVAVTTTTGAITGGTVGCSGCTGTTPGTLTFDPRVMLFPLNFPGATINTGTSNKQFEIHVGYKFNDRIPSSMGVSLRGLSAVDIRAANNGYADWFIPADAKDFRTQFSQYTPTPASGAFRGIRGEHYLPMGVLDETTVRTVLPDSRLFFFSSRSNSEFGGSIEGSIHKDLILPPRDPLWGNYGYLNSRTGELNLEGPSPRIGAYWVPNERATVRYGLREYIGSSPGTEVQPQTDSTFGQYRDPYEYQFQGLRRAVFTPITSIRPVEYEWDLAQLMIALYFSGSKSYCQNDFPLELQKLMGIQAACRLVRSARVVAAKAPTQTPAPTSIAADRPHLQAVSLRAGKYPGTDDGGGQRGGNSGGQSPVQAQQAGMAMKDIKVSIAATGNSTGPESFHYDVDDPTGKVKSLRVPEGAVLEAIKPGIVQPMKVKAGDNDVKGSLPGYCLEFNKEPPPPGTKYRLADAATQQKYSFVHYISQAAAQMKQKNLFHPDNPNADGYFQSEVQSAIWIWINKWTQEQFTQHTVEKTKQNVETLKRTWTQEMETLVRNAVPGRWRDDAELLKEAQDLESAAAGARGGRRGGRGGRGARGGRRGTQPEN